MINRIRRKYWPIGLDLGSTAMRAVQLARAKETPVLHAALELTAPYPLQADPLLPEEAGPLYETEPSAPSESDPNLPGRPRPEQKDHNETEDAQLCEQLKRLIARGGFIGREVVLNCPADRLDLRPISLPGTAGELPRDAVIGAIKLQIAEHLPFPADQAVVDYFPIRHDTGQPNLHVMAISADGSWIRRKLQLVQSAGLFCHRVDALPCALARLVCQTEQNTQRVQGPEAAQTQSTRENQSQTAQNEMKNEPLDAILDIGFAGSTLIVLKKRQPVFARRFPFGGKTLTETLAQRLAVDFSHAERLQSTIGIDCRARQLQLAQIAAPAQYESHLGGQTWATDDAEHSRPHDNQPEIAKTIYAALQADLADYVEGLTRSLNYIINEQRGAVLQRIILCGSAAHLKNLDSFLAQQFPLPVHYCRHPLIKQITELLPPTRICPGAWTTALGLALPKENW